MDGEASPALLGLGALAQEAAALAANGGAPPASRPAPTPPPAAVAPLPAIAAGRGCSSGPAYDLGRRGLARPARRFFCEALAMTSWRLVLREIGYRKANFLLACWPCWWRPACVVAAISLLAPLRPAHRTAGRRAGGRIAAEDGRPGGRLPQDHPGARLQRADPAQGPEPGRLLRGRLRLEADAGELRRAARQGPRGVDQPRLARSCNRS